METKKIFFFDVTIHKIRLNIIFIVSRSPLNVVYKPFSMSSYYLRLYFQERIFRKLENITMTKGKKYNRNSIP